MCEELPGAARITAQLRYAHICKLARSPLWGHSPLFCRYLTVQSKNRGKSKWREAPPCRVTYRQRWLDERTVGWPSSLADPGMWKWLTANQLNREIPFLQHLRSIVSVRCSLFQVTGSTLRQWYPKLLYAAPPGLPAKCGPKPPVWAYRVTCTCDCHPVRVFHTDSTLRKDFPKIFPILVKPGWSQIMRLLIMLLPRYGCNEDPHCKVSLNSQSSPLRFISRVKIGNSSFHENYDTSFSLQDEVVFDTHRYSGCYAMCITSK